jgi:membrane peptidoglycan carboxypeptidase
MGPTWLNPTPTGVPGGWRDPEAALISLDAQGRVLAMVGGKDFAASEFNLATSSGGSSRQAGSTFKPFALATAIKQGISAQSFYPALPGTLEIGGACSNNGEPWEVTGGAKPDTRYRDLIDALTVSSNIVFAALVVDITPDELRETAQDMGIRSPLQIEGGANGPFTPCSLVLGSEGVPVIDMASAYSTFERAGQRLDPVLIERVEDADGSVICWYPVDGACQSSPERTPEQVLDASVARQVNYAMTQVVEKGTGRRATAGDRLIAGKTGTSQESRDAWFAGFTCDLTTVVWMGYPEEEFPMFDFRKPLPDDGQVPLDENGDPIDDPDWRNVEGGNFPSFLWSRYMDRVAPSLPPCESLEVETEFPGTRFNQDLSTSTLPPCDVELDQYGFPRGRRPEDFVIVTTPPQEQPPPAQPGAPDGLPRQEEETPAPAGVDCIPLNDWQGQSSTTGGPATTDPAGPTTVDPSLTTTTSQSTTGTSTSTTAPTSGTTSTTAPGSSTVPSPTLPGPSVSVPTITVPDDG